MTQYICEVSMGKDNTEDITENNTRLYKVKDISHNVSAYLNSFNIVQR